MVPVNDALKWPKKISKKYPKNVHPKTGTEKKVLKDGPKKWA